MAADWLGFFILRFNVKLRGIDVADPVSIEVILGMDVMESPFDRFIPEIDIPEIDL
jgi:hypothetical protein